MPTFLVKCNHSNLPILLDMVKFLFIRGSSPAIHREYEYKCLRVKRQGREHAVNAVALREKDPRDGNSAVSDGYMTDRPKSDGVTAEHSCPDRRVRMSAVSVTKAVCRVPGPRGVWWGWPSTEVRPLYSPKINIKDHVLQKNRK